MFAFNEDSDNSHECDAAMLAQGEYYGDAMTGLKLGGLPLPVVAIARKRMASKLITMTPAAIFMAACEAVRRHAQPSGEVLGG